MQQKDRYLCIHGHFYQPPRENPWLEAVEIQDSAYPYHDWNERITAECYGPNALSRILDTQKKIQQIVSNYSDISFNLGPTLLSWLERHVPDIYQMVIESDLRSMKAHSGHGAAIAQAYSHMIMPLASTRDKRTQVIWGIRDFEFRYGRKPEGMWLPETAVDLESLDIMSEHGILYTILAPHQARRIRHGSTRAWEEVSGGRVDPSRPYVVRLPSGRKIAIFFYDSPISHAVAFEGLLNSADAFTARLMGGFSDARIGPQLMHIATDGESYGHHHKFGDMALAYTLASIKKDKTANLTNYGEYLEKFPPVYEAEIFENTSWSCAHGVERWRSNCGCNSGGNAGWSQQWRGPLRSALDWLRDELGKPFEEACRELLKDPWASRDDYINVILDRRPESIDEFFKRNARHTLNAKERTSVLKLMELERHAMLMYTSCGWFFDEISGIETVQIMQYAGRAIQIAREVFRLELEDGFISRLEAARSNVPAFSTGAGVYRKCIKPTVVDLPKVCAHYAISSLFEQYPLEAKIYCYSIRIEDYRKQQAGHTELVVGRCRITSDITEESETLSFGLVHLGNHDFTCGVKRHSVTAAYEAMAKELTDSFEHGSFADVVRLIDKHFGQTLYTLGDLFKDEQRSILTTLIAETEKDFEDTYRRLFRENRILMGFLKETGIPLPKPFHTAAEFTLNTDLRRLLEDGPGIANRAKAMIKEYEKWGLTPDTVGLEFAFRRRLESLMERVMESHDDVALLDEIEDGLAASRIMPFSTNLWKLQNIYFMIARAGQIEFGPKAEVGAGKDWKRKFLSIGETLGFNLKGKLTQETR